MGVLNIINYYIKYLFIFHYDKHQKLLLLYLIFFNSFLFHFLRNYCKQCKIKYNDKCIYCPREFVFEGINVASRKETLDELIISNKSFSRFGDGEFKIIFGIGIGFQRSNELLKIKMLNVLNNSLNNLLIGINLPYHEHELNSRPDSLRDYWKNYIKKYKFKIIDLLNVKRKYYFAQVFKYSLMIKNKKKFDFPSYIKSLKKIWDKRDILIIEGYFT